MLFNFARRSFLVSKIRFVSATAAVFAVSALTSGVAEAAIKVGMVLDRGGKDDKSFNASAFKGLSEAKEKLGIQMKVVEAPDDNSYEPALRSFAQKDFDLIIGIGIAQAEAVKKVADAFPTKKFAIVDAEVVAPNVKALLFQEHEGAYLAGALAAMKSQSGKLGFIGGMDIPLIRRFQMGYEAGAKKVNPKAQVVSNYVGVTSQAWNNPPKGKELAIAQYDGGADVIFAAAGASGAGMFDAVEERSKAGSPRFAVGVDSNQNWVKPGLVLTSMLKRVDVAVKSTVEAVNEGKFSGGIQRFGLQDKGIDLAMDEHNASIVSADMKKKLEALKKDILSGKIKVPDYYVVSGRKAR
jgi:basic membrane protein A